VLESDGKVASRVIGAPHPAKRILRRDSADPADRRRSFRGSHMKNMKKTYLRLAVMASSLMALLLAGSANIKRT
jgi:hypothetical protein